MDLNFEDKGDGFPLVFLHAFPLNLRMWDKTVAIAADQGYRTIGIDLPGFGKSPGSLDSIPAAASKVISTLKSIGLRRFVVTGLSMGGYVAFELISQSPELVAAAVFCDTTADSDTVDKRSQRRIVIEEIRKDGAEGFLSGMADSLLSTHTLRADTGKREFFMQEFRKAKPESMTAALGAMAERKSNLPKLSYFEFPVQLIFGEEDPMKPAGSEMNELIPNSELMFIENAGHFANFEQPDAFNEILMKFLNSQNLA